MFTLTEGEIFQITSGGWDPNDLEGESVAGGMGARHFESWEPRVPQSYAI